MCKTYFFSYLMPQPFGRWFRDLRRLALERRLDGVGEVVLGHLRRRSWLSSIAPV